MGKIRNKIFNFLLLGFIILLLLAFIDSCEKGKNKEEIIAHLKDPSAKLVILVHSDENPITFYYIKIISIKGDEIHYIQSPWFYKKQPKKMKLNDGFIQKSSVISLTRYQELLDKGYFVDALWDYDENSRYTKAFALEEFY